MYNQIYYDKGIVSSFVQIKLYDRTLTKHLDNQDPESPPIGIYHQTLKFRSRKTLRNHEIFCCQVCYM